MNKLACIFSSPSYSLVALVINFLHCCTFNFNFTLYTKRTYMCDTYGLITANSTCPFGTSWSQLYMCPTVGHVSSNGGHCAQDGWMHKDATNCSSRPCSPDVNTVRVHARVRASRMGFYPSVYVPFLILDPSSAPFREIVPAVLRRVWVVRFLRASMVRATA